MQRVEAQRGKNTDEYCPARAAPLRGGELRTHIQPSDGTCSPHGGAAKPNGAAKRRHNQTAPQRTEAQRGKNTDEYCPARAAPLRGGELRTHIQPSDGTCSPHGGAAKGRHNQTGQRKGGTTKRHHRGRKHRGVRTQASIALRGRRPSGGGPQMRDGSAASSHSKNAGALASRRAGCKKVANPNSGHTDRHTDRFGRFEKKGTP